jgi:3-methyladenine DNA glycosylase AlkD
MAAKKKTGSKTAVSKKAAAKAPAPQLRSFVAELKRDASPLLKTDMAKRYGIVTKAEVYGTSVATLRAMAKRIGRDHQLAEKLWAGGIYDAGMLASMVGDPVPMADRRWQPSGNSVANRL